MNINRNNYETFFLLYVDNELSAPEKNKVDIFVAENPDLQEELLMLQQTIIKADDITFSGKEGLLKPQPLDTLTEEKLLLLLDNELPVKEKEELLGLIKENEDVNAAWLLLQQAKLASTDTIIFEDKASLYRKEERRVIPIRWWQMAAAAMLIGAGLWGTVSYLNKNVQTGIPTETATTKGNTAPAIKESNTIKPITDTVLNTDKLNDNAATAAAVVQQPGAATATTPADKIKKDVAPEPNNGNDELVQQPNKNEDSPAFDLQKLNNPASNKIEIASVQPQTNNDQPTIKIDRPEINNTLKNEYAVNTSAGGNDEIGFGDEEEGDRPKKSKLGGFFKKVKRTFERTTKIKTGSSDDVKIANMSFAMH